MTSRLAIEIEMTAPLASSRPADESASPSGLNLRPRNGDEHALPPHQRQSTPL